MAREGAAAVAEALEADLWLERGLRSGLSAEEARLGRRVFAGGNEAGERVRQLVTAGDPAGAKALWREVDTATRKIRDYRMC